MLRRDFREIPRADRVLRGLEYRVFAYALIAAEHERVVDFFLRALRPMGKELLDVRGVGLAKNIIDVIEPPVGLGRIAQSDGGRPVKVEASNAVSVDPA